MIASTVEGNARQITPQFNPLPLLRGEEAKSRAATVRATVTLPSLPGTLVTGHDARGEVLGEVEHTFSKPGDYLVTVRGERHDAAPVVEQTAIHVGEAPPEIVLYDLPLNDAGAAPGAP